MFDLKIVIIGDGIARLTAAIEIKIKFLLETKNSIHNNSGMDFMLH
ncbi:MAG: aspartate oxidase [Roseivirga sp.]|jgi:aspartate oxidase